MFKTLDIRSKYGFWRVSADTGSPITTFGDRLGRLALQACHFYGSLYYTRILKKFNKNLTFLRKFIADNNWATNGHESSRIFFASEGTEDTEGFQSAWRTRQNLLVKQALSQMFAFVRRGIGNAPLMRLTERRYEGTTENQISKIKGQNYKSKIKMGWRSFDHAPFD